MKILVQRDVAGYSFVVEKSEGFETVDEVIKACLQLEHELMVSENEEEDE